MQFAQDVLPWQIVDLGLQPFPDYWPFNPSIHFDGEVWRCALRNSDYAMPDGVTVRSRTARPVGNQTRNAMVILDPRTWQPIQLFQMQELDALPRVTCASIGYEDIRLFKTERGGLQGIAASLHLDRGGPVVAGGSRNQPPEQVVLAFDENYNVVRAEPLRASRWNGSPQKNWVPFDGGVEPQFLYSIERGILLGARGELMQAVTSEPRPALVPATAPKGRRINADTLLSRPAMSRYGNVRGQPVTRVLGAAGGALPVKYAGLRGGSQLVPVWEDAWLGIGHEMKFVNGRKYYWHTWYVVNGQGRLVSKSPPMKLVPNGIEFAAGLAVDGDRVVVSFGVDDMRALLGETSLDAVEAILQPAERISV